MCFQRQLEARPSQKEYVLCYLFVHPASAWIGLSVISVGSASANRGAADPRSDRCVRRECAHGLCKRNHGQRAWSKQCTHNIQQFRNVVWLVKWCNYIIGFGLQRRVCFISRDVLQHVFVCCWVTAKYGISVTMVLVVVGTRHVHSQGAPHPGHIDMYKLRKLILMIPYDP